MKSEFRSKVTKRLISAFLVLAMLITCIPVTQAKAGMEDGTIDDSVRNYYIEAGKYQYKNDFYTIHGSKQTGDKVLAVTYNQREDYKPVEGKNIGLLDSEAAQNIDYTNLYPDEEYVYAFNIDEVKRLMAGETFTFHFDRLGQLYLNSDEWTNVTLDQFYIESSYTNKKGKKIKQRTMSDGVDCTYENINHRYIAGFDCTVKIRLASKKLYREKTSFELPEGEKGMKKHTYNSEGWIANWGIQEPAIMINAKTGKKIKSYSWGDAIYSALPNNKSGKVTYILKGLYTGREQKFTVNFEKDGRSSYYDKFKKKLKLTSIDYNIIGD